MNNEKYCIGCGVKLQDSNMLFEGYTPDLSNDICSRCFKLKNYGEYEITTKSNEEYIDILKAVNDTKDLVLYVVDLLNIEKDIKVIREYVQNRLILVLTKRDILPFLKDFVTKIIKNMGLDVQVETKVKDEIPYITVYSDDNAILIGKNGRTMEAIALVARQALQNELGEHYKFQLDVGDYKVKRQKNLERLAKKTAREVYNTNIPVKLEPMNSYERRIIHAILADNPKITTASEGEEPNRCVVISKVEEDE